MSLKPIILIPARFASTRFPGKPLAMIKGKSLLERVYSNIRKTNINLAIVTDDDRIEQHAKNFGANVVRVDDDVQSGTERIFLAYERFFKNTSDLIVNVQGDEPLLLASEIIKLIEFHTSSKYDIATIVKERDSSEPDFESSDIVKAVYMNGHCPYFSRSKIPFSRDKIDFKWYQHIGVYSYRPKALELFCKALPSHLEKLEKLEQLRALELNLSIGAVISNLKLIGVDRPEDIYKVEGLL